MTSPHFLVQVDSDLCAHVQASGELWAPEIAELQNVLLALRRLGEEQIHVDLSQAEPGFLAVELLLEVLGRDAGRRPIVIEGWPGIPTAEVAAP